MYFFLVVVADGIVIIILNQKILEKKYLGINIGISTILSHYPMQCAIPIKFKRASEKIVGKNNVKLNITQPYCSKINNKHIAPK